MKKILYFTKYTRKGASSRLRSFQYIPYLKEAGYRVEVFPLFDDRYLTDLYKGQKSLSNILSAYRRRFSDLKKVKEGDTDYVLNQYKSGILVKSFSEEDYKEAISQFNEIHFDPAAIQAGAAGFFSLEEGSFMQMCIRRY